MFDNVEHTENPYAKQKTKAWMLSIGDTCYYNHKRYKVVETNHNSRVVLQSIFSKKTINGGVWVHVNANWKCKIICGGSGGG